MTIDEDSGEASESIATKLAPLDAAITRGLDDAEAGRTKPSSEVSDRLEANLADRANRVRSSLNSPQD
ncbi:hypothetical protein ACFPFP_20535 [Bradyrhizobium sp. GCM10023182]|uniref:hypothetical protein n=1 Tax=Bradyrhizobium TaxID=374 RepID=UPI003613F9C7